MTTCAEREEKMAGLTWSSTSPSSLASVLGSLEPETAGFIGGCLDCNEMPWREVIQMLG